MERQLDFKKSDIYTACGHHRYLLTAGGKAQYECNCLIFTLLQLFEFTCIHATLKYVYFCVNIHIYGSNIM